MESVVTKIIRNRLCVRVAGICFAKRNNSKLPKFYQEKDKISVAKVYPHSVTKYWNENAALKRRRKDKYFPRSANSVTDLIKVLQDINNFPKSFTGVIEFFLKKLRRKDLLNQEFFPEREAVLKPDLAAATFIVQRGGHVKFFGQDYWIGREEEKQSLPITYIPGLHIEAINAENTLLRFEGLQNIRKLKYLKYLSLKGLEGINDWCLDYISKEFYASLKHLDISYCPNVTYRSLSCFYRFECLRTLNLEGVPDTPELKLACVMLLDICPNLDIRGIDLSVPEKIESVNLEQTKHLSDGKVTSETQNEFSENNSDSNVKQASKI